LLGIYFYLSLDMEIFKAIQGYEGLYEISNLGVVKSLPKERVFGNRTFLTKEKTLKQRIHDGYYRVNLCGVGKMKTFNVHLLVIRAFVPKEEDKNFANHKDFNKLNNHFENLEWVTTSENNSHRHINKGKKTSKYVGVCKSKNSFASRLCLNGKQVNIGSFNNEEDAYKAVVNFTTTNNIVNKYI